MKKVLGVLVALLVVSPAMADVNMTITDAGEGWAEISYATPGEPNLPRAFALKIEITAGSATIDGVQFAAGTGDEACATCQDFKIHPGNIQIDGAGNVVSWGKPVAPGNAPDNPPQLPSTTYIIIEMGSLYHKGVDPAPNPSGLLIRVHVDASCTLTVSEEATVRGGVVLEDPTIDPTVNGDSKDIDVCVISHPDAVHADLCDMYFDHTNPDGMVNADDFLFLKYYYEKTSLVGKKCSDLVGTEKIQCDIADICDMYFDPLNPDDVVSADDFLFLKYYYEELMPYGQKICH